MPQIDSLLVYQSLVPAAGAIPAWEPVLSEKEVDMEAWQGVVGDSAAALNASTSPREVVSADWVLLVLLPLLAGLAWIKATRPRRFPELFRMFVYQRFVRQSMREDDLLADFSSIVLALVFVFSGGLLLWEAGEALGIKVQVLGEQKGPLLFLVFSACLFGAYLLKFLGIRIMQFLFDTDRGLKEYLYTTWLTNVVLGLVLLPLVFTVVFSNWEGVTYLVWGGLGLAGLFYLYRIGRGIRIGIVNNVSVFYLFLYLCTLEILPLIVLTVLFTGQIG